MTESMTYAGIGVDYDAMDPFKRMAQRAVRETADTLKRFDSSEVEVEQGEAFTLSKCQTATWHFFYENRASRVFHRQAI